MDSALAVIKPVLAKLSSLPLRRTVEGVLIGTSVASLVTYVLPIIWSYLRGVQNLKRKYNASWGLVTGASSGMGLAVVKKLASQGVNVVMVALDDDLLRASHADMQKAYPALQFRKVGVNLGAYGAGDGATDYLSVIAAATADIDVQIVFNNAGYLLVGTFPKLTLERQLANLECNVISHIKIAHLFMTRMIEKKLKGGICFTASQTAFFPTPMSVMYGATKAFLQAFAMNLSMEGAQYGIDVSVVLPGYTRTNLYKETPKLSAMSFFERMAATPEQMADVMFRTLGRVAVRDTGGYTHVTRMLTNVLNVNWLVRLISIFLGSSKDYKDHPELH